MTVISTNVAIFNIFDSALPTPPCLTLSFKTALVSPFGFVVYFTLPSDGSNQRQRKNVWKIYCPQRERGVYDFVEEYSQRERVNVSQWYYAMVQFSLKLLQSVPKNILCWKRNLLEKSVENSTLLGS